MYQDKLVDEDDIEWMKGKDGYLPDRVVHLQCSKHPEMMTRSANALGMFGYYDSANQLRGWCGWVWVGVWEWWCMLENCILIPK